MPLVQRNSLASLWALDETLGRIVAAARDPMIAQLRLTWWQGALADLKPGAHQGQPVLDALASVMRCHDVTGAALTAMVEGWEALLDPLPLDDGALQTHGEERGSRLFSISAQMLGGVASADAGAGWALADFARRCSDAGTAARAFAAATQLLTSEAIAGLPVPLRILARLAARDALHGQAMPRTRWQLLRAIY